MIFDCNYLSTLHKLMLKIQENILDYVAAFEYGNSSVKKALYKNIEWAHKGNFSKPIEGAELFLNETTLRIDFLERNESVEYKLINEITENTFNPIIITEIMRRLNVHKDSNGKLYSCSTREIAEIEQLMAGIIYEEDAPDYQSNMYFLDGKNEDFSTLYLISDSLTKFNNISASKFIIEYDCNL